MLKEAISFLMNIKPDDEIIIIFHNDCDGISSCALMNKFLKNKIGKSADFIISQPMPPTKNLLQRIRMSIPTKIIFLDLAIDQERVLIKRLENICEILIIDHHQISNNLNSKRTIHYNPLFRGKVYQSASYLTYKICSKILDMKKYLWIAAVGIVGDYNIDDSMDLIKEIKKEYPNLFSQENDIRSAIFNSIFGHISNIITAMKASRVSCERVVKIMDSAETITEIEKNKEFLDYYEKVQEEIDRMMINIKSSVDDSKRVIFYEIKSKYNLRSVIATKLSEIYPKKLVVVWDVIRNNVKFSARNQDRTIDVEKVLREAASDFKYASVGGHESAAGGSIRKEDFEDFKNALMLLVS